jgi:hypothetical protein
MHPDSAPDVLLENMTTAYDRICASLQVTGWGLTEEMLAKKIIAAASRGLWETDEICSQVLKELLH